MEHNQLHTNFTFIKDELDILNSNASKILFINGGMDPWLPACVHQDTFNDQENLPVYVIKNASHHLETFLPRSNDTIGLKIVRLKIINHLD